MQVRLAFSVASHLEPDILIIDEVLAVGDAEFQKKCLGKMDEVVKTDGRTILFVSHDMSAIRRICNRLIVLDQGKVAFIGDVSEGIRKYFSDKTINNPEVVFGEKKAGLSKKLTIRKAKITNQNGVPEVHYKYGDVVDLEISYSVHEKLDGSLISFEVINSEGLCIFTSTSQDSKGVMENTKLPGDYKYTIQIDTKLFTKPNSYYISFAATIPKLEYLDQPKETLFFDVSEGETAPSYLLAHGRRGVIEPILEWKNS